MISVVHASGTPRDRGRAVGRGLAEQIGRSCAFYERYFSRRGIDLGGIDRLSAPFLAAAERYLPEHVEVLRGMAEGAEVPFECIVAANAFEELDPLAPSPVQIERCTAIVSVGTDRTLLGHTEQWLAGDLGCAGIVVDDPGGDALWVVSPVVASWLPAVGVNAAGGAVSVMSLSADDDGVGIPRVLVSRNALGSSDPLDAVRRATIAPRSGGYAYSWAWRGGETLTIETSATGHATVTAPCHANHYLDPGLAAVGEPPSPGSLRRNERAHALLDASPPGTIEEMMAILADHEGEPQPICVHPEPADGDEATCVVFAMAVDLEGGELWVADGNACEGRIERLTLGELLA